MISGIVTDRHATVTLTFLLPSGSTLPIEFVIDTGFTGDLCLPPEAVALLRFPFIYDLPANLADNSDVLLPVHEAVVIWDGEEREVRVIATGCDRYLELVCWTIKNLLFSSPKAGW